MMLDTSGLLCYFDATERHHADADNFFNTAASKMVHSYILAEFVALCQARKLKRRDSLLFTAYLANNSEVEMIWVDAVLHTAALELLQARMDKTYSLCDAVSFVIMRERSIAAALTTDHHFEQEGFQRLLV